MRELLENLIKQALDKLQENGTLSAITGIEIKVEKTRDSRHGDFASNIAMILAAHSEKTPRKLAEIIVEFIPASNLVKQIEIAGPGFINFFLSADSARDIIRVILEQAEKAQALEIDRP